MRKLIALAALAALLSFVARDRTAAAGNPGALTLKDTSGAPHKILENTGAKARVLFFIGTECPMSNRYHTRFADLHTAFAEKGVAFFAINANALETDEAIAKHALEAALPFPVLIDRDQEAAARYEVTTIPCAVVLDAEGGVRYRGRIDDNKTEQLAKNHYVQAALDAILANKEVAVSSTEPVGCLLQRRLEAAKTPEVTYASHVAGILNKNCVSCHRPGQVAPFSLLGFEEAERWALNIKGAVQAKRMPPWKPMNHGVFRDERVMTEEEIATLTKWVEAGAPLGDPEKVPPDPAFAEGWMLGEPDLVLEGPEYELGPTGDDEYRCFVMPTDLPEDKWISAVELRPGNFSVVHHFLGYVDVSGEAEKLDAADPKPGYTSAGTGPGFIPAGEMGGWAPGVMPYAQPDGIGRLLPKGARVVIETHYHRNGRTEKDRTRVGLHFAKTPIKQRLRWSTFVNYWFKIPAGDKHFKVVATESVDEDIHAWSVVPHMHLTGRSAKITARFPDGTRKTLVDIQDWDFNWQDIYHFKEPVALPKGTKVTMVSYYDNSTENPNNPNNPPREIRWGEQTTDEMCIGFIGFTRDHEDRTKGQ